MGTGPPSLGHLRHHSALDTAAHPSYYRRLERPKPSPLSSPPQPFWFFPFPYFWRGGVFIFNFALQLAVGWEAAFGQSEVREKGQEEGLAIAPVSRVPHSLQRGPCLPWGLSAELHLRPSLACEKHSCAHPAAQVHTHPALLPQ